MGWMDRYIDKKVYIVLKDKRRYSGIVISIENDIVTILDKVQMKVSFREDSIELIQEELE